MGWDINHQLIFKFEEAKAFLYKSVEHVGTGIDVLNSDYEFYSLYPGTISRHLLF